MNDCFITNIKINQVRNIKDTSIKLSDDVSKNLIITGPNGSGKTSLLESLRFQITNLLKADGKIFSENVNHLKKQFSDETIILTHSESMKYVKLTDENSNKSDLINYITNISGLNVDIKNFDRVQDEYLKGKFIVSYYQAEREYIVKSEKQIRNVGFKNTYTVNENPGKDFVEYLKSLIIQENMYRYKKSDTKIADDLQQRIERIKRIIQNIYDNDDIDFDFDIETMNLRIKEPEKMPYSFDELASGYAAVFYIVLDLMMRMEKKVTDAYDLPGIVMIDEVDAHLHLSMQRNVLKNLTELFPNIQFIVTTHSPFVLNSVENAVIYDLGNNMRIDSEDGLYKLPILAL